MAIYSPTNSPEQNLAVLNQTEYPGRLLVVGFAARTSILAYAVEGRSEGSRNRRLVVQDNVVSTEIVDPSLSVGDPELTIYDAMRRVDDIEIVSNGNQTDRVIRYVRSGMTFADAMEATDHEPDKPNFTPRITGFHHSDADDGEPYFGISVVSKNPDGEGSVHKLYTDQSPEITLDDGSESVGYAVHTYQGDGTPLPSFDEPPFKIPVLEGARDMAELLWENLNRENRVAVAVKTINDSGVISYYIKNQSDPDRFVSNAA
jgi:IMP cyclohydrolase